MQFRKIAAVAGSALMAGMTLAGAALAASISDVGHVADTVTATDFPILVVGSGGTNPAGLASDISGAINIAAYLAGKSETKTTAATTGVETVTQGAKLETPGNALEPWESTQTVKSVFTKSDLDILAEGTFLTATGGTYTYKQFLYPATAADLTAATTAPLQMKFERATTGSQTAKPDLWLKSTGSKALYTYKLSFATAVPLTSVTDSTTLKAVIQGQTIKLLGKDYVISDATYYSATNTISDMTLLGGKNVVLLNHIAGTAATTEKITVDGKEYSITFNGITTSGTTDSASFTVEEGGTKSSYSIQQGGTDTFKGITVGVIKLGKTAITGGNEILKVVLGADKIKIAAAGNLIKGTTTVSDVATAITASVAGGWSVLAITYTPSNDQWLGVGEKITDPFIGAFDIKFNGFTPTFDDKTDRQTITLSRSGDNMYLTYKNAGGAEKQMDSVLYSSTCPTSGWKSNVANYCFASIASGSPSGYDNNFRDVIFDESANISAKEDDYFVIQKGGFSHLMKFTSFTPSTSELVFNDESGSSQTISNSTTTADADLIVDGNTYKVRIMDATKEIVAIDLNGDGYIGVATAATSYNSTYVQLGAQYSFLVPEKITTGQGGLYFYKGSNNATIPTAGYAYPELGFAGIRLSNASTTVSVGAYGYAATDTTWAGTATPGTWANSGTTLTVPTSGWSAWTNYTVNYIDFGVRCTNNSVGAAYTCEAALGGTTGAQTGSVGYILVEEAQQGGTTHSWVYMPLTYETTYKISVTTPVSDDSNYAHTAVQGTSTEYRGMTKYGTLIEDKSAQLGGGATLSYPELYVYGNVYFLAPEGTITSATGTEAGTYQAVLHPQVTADVAMLDIEVDKTVKETKDLIVVGGPAVNKIAADLMGKTYPAYGAESGIPENAALVKVFKDKFATGKSAILIAGWEAKDTDLATRLVQTGKLAARTEAAVQVSGEVASPTISEYTEAATPAAGAEE